jgi:RNA polymerase sigma factor (TIGR02999 family)
MTDPSPVSRILNEIERGECQASNELLPLVYDELRRLATHRLSQEPAGQTLQPTALVHEAYVRLVGNDAPQQWDSRGHFFAAAAESMRRILVDNARRKRSQKHGGEHQRVDIDLGQIDGESALDDLVSLDEALNKLAEKDQRKAKLVELRFFSGLTIRQAAQVLDVSVATAERDWTFARAWLHREISDDTEIA